MDRRFVSGALGLLLATGLAACGDDGDDAQSVPSTVGPADVSTPAEPDEALPPPGALDLEPMYGEALADLGLVLTDRGGLIDRSGGRYEASDSGTHLALYVEPIGERTVEEYVEGIRTVAVVFADVFERWPGLESYDVCQEPSAADDNRDEPLPVTQIELTKDENEAIDWATVTAAELIQLAQADPPGLALRVSSALAQDEAYTSLVDPG